MIPSPEVKIRTLLISEDATLAKYFLDMILLKQTIVG